jgi:hypothetical protein
LFCGNLFFYLGETNGNDEDGMHGIQIEHLEQKLRGGLCVDRDDEDGLYGIQIEHLEQKLRN